jgi:hypothetical protein
MSHLIPSAVQLRYTGAHGPLLRDDGKTKPIALDDIERLYGEFVLNEVMENPGRWVDVTAPNNAVLAATVNERVFTVHVVSADRVPADFTVDADAGTITLPVNASLFSLVQALHTAKQHEPSVVTKPAPATMPYRCWSTRGGEIVCIVLPGIAKRVIPMERAAAHPPLRDIFNKVREAETKAWAGGLHATRPQVFVHLSDEEVEPLLERDAPLPRLRPITARPLQLRHTPDGTNPAA